MNAFIANLPRLPKREEHQSVNPITLIRSLTLLQHAFFASAWLAWTCDAIDFFAVSLSVTALSEQFGESTKNITTSITLTLLFRPLGAIIFGLLSDRYGRKWPLIANLLACAVLSLGTGFVNDYGSFLGVRSLFGVSMGGIWGQCASLGLENMPVEARGLFSGILQQGYAVGYLVAAVINLYAVPKHSYRILFYIGAGISLFAAIIRLALPESQYFIERSAAAKLAGTQISSAQKSKTFISEAGKALRLHWIRCIFAILLMTGFNFYSQFRLLLYTCMMLVADPWPPFPGSLAPAPSSPSLASLGSAPFVTPLLLAAPDATYLIMYSGSQDLYPVYVENGKGLSKHSATVATILGNCGAIAGGFMAGWASQYLGRRITVMICCIWTCCFIPLWLLPNSFPGLGAGAFFVQFGVQGAWSVVPIWLAEISPVAYRASFPGIAYQLGNMVSAASAQIETTAGDKIKTPEGLPDYGKVSAILIGVVSAWLIVCCIVGREDHGAHFERGKAAFEKGGGLDEMDDRHDRLPELRGDEEKGSVAHEEKGQVQQREIA